MLEHESHETVEYHAKDGTPASMRIFPPATPMFPLWFAFQPWGCAVTTIIISPRS
jgi:hypothetical protein